MHTSKVAPPHASKEKASLITSLAMIPPSTRSTVRTLAETAVTGTIVQTYVTAIEERLLEFTFLLTHVWIRERVLYAAFTLY